MPSVRPFDPTDLKKGYIADTGLRGRGGRKLFDTEAEARQFLGLQNHRPNAELFLAEHKNELLDCYDQLVKVRATFREAVDYFIKFGASRANPKLSVLVEQIIAKRTDSGRTPEYLDNIKNASRMFIDFLKNDPELLSVTSEQLTLFFYGPQKWKTNGYRINVFTHLKVVFSYALINGMRPDNPMKRLDKPPKHRRNPPKAIRPEHLEKLLHVCYKNGWHDRLVVFVLIAFLGIRKKEITRITWAHIDFKKNKISVPTAAAKIGDNLRRLDIPPNALEWLELVYDKRRTGVIIGRTFETLCRSARHAAKIPYSKNIIRNAFPSYALEAKWDEKLVKKHMEHTERSSTLWDNYLAIVEPEDAKKYWAIRPTAALLRTPWVAFKKRNYRKISNDSSLPVKEIQDLPDDAEIQVNE